MTDNATPAAASPAAVPNPAPAAPVAKIGLWGKIKTFFKNSETIFLARVQMAIGAVGAVVTGLMADARIDGAIQQILKPQYIPYYIIALGVITEALRRRRATDL
jgi:hypothetical protein